MRVILNYLVAACAVAIATGLTWLGRDVIEPAVALLFAAVMASAWFGGFGPGLLAAVLAAAVSELLIVDRSRGGGWGLEVRGLTRVALLLWSAVLVGWLNGERRRAEGALRNARDDLEKRVRERTTELTAANERLRTEVAERQRAERDIIAHQAQLRELASELALAEERQLRRVAVELHDGIGQLLGIARIRTDLLDESVTGAGGTHAAAAEVGQIRELLDEAIQRTRSLTVELSPPLLYESGLRSALEWLAARVQQRHRIRIDVEADPEADAITRGPGRRVDDELCVLVFQAVRELLANLTKHAKATHGRVAIAAGDGHLRVVVEDNGVGLDPTVALDGHDQNGKAKNAFGLFSIRERLRHHGGRLEVDAAPGRGARFTLVLPLGASRNGAKEPAQREA